MNTFTYSFLLLLIVNQCKARSLREEGCYDDDLMKSPGDVWRKSTTSFGDSYCVECECSWFGKMECNTLPCSTECSGEQDCCQSCDSPRPLRVSRSSVATKSKFNRRRQSPDPILEVGRQISNGDVMEGDFGMFLAGSEIISRVPKKNGCFSESRFRQNGEVFPMGVSNRYQATCSMCACVDGNVYCRTKTCGPSRCPRPVSSSSDCCLVCPTEDTAIVSVSRPTVSTRLSCKSGETVYESGAIWKPNVPSMSNACVQCSCENGNIRCRIPKCPEVKCAYPILPEDRCCRVCPTTTVPPRTTSTPPPSACDGELQLSQFIPIPGTPQEHQIDFSFRLNKTYNSTVPSLPVGIVISVKLPRTFLVYDWMIDSGDKRRQVLNVRPSVFQKYSATRNHLGSFQMVGYITKKRLENFRRKESRWSKHCRKRCSDRLKRILNALASKRAPCKV